MGATVGPGTRGIIDVRRAELGPGGHRWQCHRCEDWFPVELAWTVRARIRGRRLVAVVCPSCAPLYRGSPHVVIDLTRLERVRRTSPGSELVDRVVRAAREAARMRRNPTVPTMAMRSSDIRGLAAEAGVSPGEVHERLRARGLLAPDHTHRTGREPPSGDRPIRVVAADSYRHIRDLLRLLCAEDDRVQLVGEATSADRALELAAETCADVLLLDERLCGPDAAAGIGRLRSRPPGAAVVLLTHDQSTVWSGQPETTWGAVVSKDDLVDVVDRVVEVHERTRWQRASITPD